MEVSVVIPVFNEEANIGPLLERIAQTLPSLPSPYEVIVVDDGSKDATVVKLLAGRQHCPWLRVVELRRNFGQHIATYAGFDHARGKFVVTLDGDLQNDPADIPKLLEKMREGYDVVCGWRMERKDPFLSRKLPSLIVNRIIRSDAPTPIHDYGCFLRAYTAQAAKELSMYSTPRGWFPVLFSKLGFRVGEVAVSHHERPGDEPSHHDLFTRIDQFMSVFIGVKTKPFQFAEILGGAGIAVGGLGLIIGLARWLVGVRDGTGLLCLLAVGLSLWGFLMAVIGLVGEYLGHTYYDLRRHPKYLVRQIHD
jgi:glycosyltransferase involved in cell wall biosynthesis